MSAWDARSAVMLLVERLDTPSSEIIYWRPPPESYPTDAAADGKNEKVFVLDDWEIWNGQ